MSDYVYDTNNSDQEDIDTHKVLLNSLSHKLNSDD